MGRTSHINIKRKLHLKKMRNLKRTYSQNKKLNTEEDTSKHVVVETNENDNIVAGSTDIPEHLNTAKEVEENANRLNNNSDIPDFLNIEEEVEQNINRIEDNSDVLEYLNIEGEVDKNVALTPINGMRIINIAHFFSELQKISTHGCIGCGLTSVNIISESKVGLVSKFKLKCKMCNELFYIGCNDLDVDLNINAVAGAVAIGCGRTQVNELFAAMNLPQISFKVFGKRMSTVNKVWKEEIELSMQKAAQEEHKLATEEGRVNVNGIPLIDVIADGCWGKRSYKKNYSSLSGAAAIIGKRTGKILFMAVKNKYCCICSVAAKKNITPKEHECYKNYSGPSTGMESTILVEGFKNSIEMHNLIYARLISDGDANTYSKLLQSRPYEDITIEKIECRNHLLRNFCNKLQSLAIDTKYLIKYRKQVTKKRILTMRKVIINAIKKYKCSENITGLHNDIMLAANHAFGTHANCKPYFCSKIGVDETTDKDIFTNNFWHRINLILTHIAAHARSLIQDVDSNIVERYHSIVAKFVGGKRINFSQKYQYEMRCNAAALSFNTNKPISLLQKRITGKSPRGQVKRMEVQKRKRLQLGQKYNRIKKRLFDQPAESSKNYGEECLRPDMDNNMLEETKKIFLRNLDTTAEQRYKIERNTILQSGSSEWLELRRRTLTASNFGRVIKRRMDVSCCNLVKDILYKDSIEHVKSIKHGLDNENLAKEQLCKQENIKIERCGLFIDKEISFIGASPDGLIGDDTILEIKCPITAFKLGFERALNEKKIPFYRKNPDGTYSINKEHNWYYQIQGQLHVTTKLKCLFGIWFGEQFRVKTETIFKDDDFWETKMKPKLVKFYMDCMLPELVDPRHTRNMVIRDPVYIADAVKARKRKNEDKENKGIKIVPKKKHAIDETNILKSEEIPESVEISILGENDQNIVLQEFNDQTLHQGEIYEDSVTGRSIVLKQKVLDFSEM